MKTVTDFIKSRFSFRLDNATNVLIVVNVAIWLLLIFADIVLFVCNVSFKPWFLEVPSDLSLFWKMPWTAVTYCFLHTSIGHIFFNMLALYIFGHKAEEFFSSMQIVIVYLLGGIAGAAMFLFAFNTFPYFSERFHTTFLLGASASVLAIVTAAVSAHPSAKFNLIFIGEISLKWLAIIMVVTSFLGVTGNNAGGDIAHLGGALLGVVYGLIYRAIPSNNTSTGKSTSSHFSNPFTRTAHSSSASNSSYHFQRGTRYAEPDFSTGYSNQNSNRNSDSSTYSASSNSANQTEIDRILDKIKHTGYVSLTEDEKQRLFRR